MRLHVKLISLTLALLFIGSIGAVAVSAQSSSTSANSSNAGVVSAQAAIQINTMQFRYDAQHTGDYSPVAGPAPPNGQLKWSYTTGNIVWSSPVVANGVVYVGSYDNKVYALNATTGAKKWNYTTGHYVYSSPAVANGVVYVGSYDNKVYALNATTGAKLWSYTTGSYIESSPAVANGVVYVGSYDNKVYALNAATGAFKWDYLTGNEIRSSPAVANGVVYVGSYDNKVYALNATTGAKLWNYTTDQAVQSSPAVANGVVYVGSYDNKVYALNATTGAKKWSYTTENSVFSSPAVANGMVYVGSYDSNVYALGNQPEPKMPTALNATASKTAATVKQNFTIKGRLTANGAGLAYKTVTLQRSTDNKTFTTSTTRLTNGTGWYGLSRNETTAQTYYYRTKYAGDTTYTNATSKVVTVAVTKKSTTFSIATSPTAPKLNVAFTVLGTLKSGTSGLIGLSVHLERKIGSGAWTDVAGTTKNTGTGGTVSVSQKVTSHNTYSYRWHFTGTATYKPCYSSPVKTFTV